MKKTFSRFQIAYIHVILLLLITLHFGYKHFKKKAPSPILMIVLSAGLGILFLSLIHI